MNESYDVDKKRGIALVNRNAVDYANSCMDNGITPEDSLLFERGILDIAYSVKKENELSKRDRGYSVPHGSVRIARTRERLARDGVWD